jgi:hypothetical protein
MFGYSIPMFMQQPYMEQAPPRYPRRYDNSRRKKDITIEEFRELIRFMKEMTENFESTEEKYKHKYKQKEEKKEEQKRGLHFLETALLFALLSPFIGIGMLNVYGSLLNMVHLPH